jgi:hypothetical protein
MRMFMLLFPAGGWLALLLLLSPPAQGDAANKARLLNEYAPAQDRPLREFVEARARCLVNDDLLFPGWDKAHEAAAALAASITDKELKGELSTYLDQTFSESELEAIFGTFRNPSDQKLFSVLQQAESEMVKIALDRMKERFETVIATAQGPQVSQDFSTVPKATSSLTKLIWTVFPSTGECRNGP